MRNSPLTELGRKTRKEKFNVRWLFDKRGHKVGFEVIKKMNRVKGGRKETQQEIELGNRHVKRASRQNIKDRFKKGWDEQGTRIDKNNLQA